MLFTIWNPETGEIIGSGVASEAEALAHERGGMKVKLGEAISSATHCINPATGRKRLLPERRSQALLAFDITCERERRLDVGFAFDFGDARGTHRIGASDGDWAGWQEVHAKASKALLRGKPETEIAIVTNTGPVTVTGEEWLGLLDAIEDFRQPILLASFALAAMSPIPQNVTAAKWWPK